MNSIIVCGYNKVEELSVPCIEAISENTTVPFELIGVDDASTDDTYDYFCSTCDQSFRLAANSGPGIARNIGLQASQGDCLVFVDNDVIVPFGWLAELTRESGAMGDGILGAVPSDEIWKIHSRPVALDGLMQVYDVASACMLLTRRVFQALGFLDPNLSYRGTDTDYCYRAQLAGFRVAQTPDVIVQHTPHSTLGGMQDLTALGLEKFRAKWNPYAAIFPVP